MTTFRNGILVLLCACLCGCSTSNDTSIVLDPSGKHVAGWVVAGRGGNHPAAYLSAQDTCKECHGTDLTGGISRVSCFSSDRNGISCHAQGPSGHPAGWSDPGAHGAHAKAAATGADGMAFCAHCHGSDFRGGTTGVSCFSCHATSPHALPWLGSTGATTHLHSSTDATNASVCGSCHGGGAKLATPTAPPANSGCFNSTLCHGTKIAHAFPNPGSLHRASTSGCSSCHAIGTGASPYPAASTGAPPDCKSCHKLSTATTIPQMTGCSDCHGDAATGRPNGSVFPNIGRRHSNPSEHAVACATCHAGGGTGSVTHGNSNNIVKTAANVILNGTASGMSIVRNAGTGTVTCTGTCHGESHNGRTW